MLHSEVKSLKSTRSVKSGHGTPINRSRLLGWADETLSKLKSDRNFLRKSVKKTKHEAKSVNDYFSTTPSKEGKYEREQIAELKPNEVATYVSEIVTSKLKRKVQHMAFDTGATGDKQENKCVNNEHFTNTEANKSGDEQCSFNSKHGFATSYSDDQDGDLYGHDIYTKKKKKKKRESNESAVSECSTVNSSSEVPLLLWELEIEETPKKKKKLIEHYRSDKVRCFHCCKCASKATEAQRTEINTGDETSAFDDSEALSVSRTVRKHKTHKDYYTGNENQAASEKMESTAAYKQGKSQKPKRAFDRMLEKGNQSSDEDILKGSPKTKKKEKRYYVHSVSEESISKRKELKKYKLCTEKCEQRPNSENKDQMGSGKKRESFSKRREKEACKGYCNFGEKKKKHECGYSFGENLEEAENLCCCCYKTECSSKGRKQKTDKKNSHDDFVECKKKKKKVKDSSYSKSETTSVETEEHTESHFYGSSDLGSVNKKKRKKAKENSNYKESISDLEQRSKKKLYCSRKNVNTMEASDIQEKQRKKRKVIEKEYYNHSSLDADEGGKKKRKKKHKEDISANEKLKTGDFIEDHAMSDVAFSNTKYSKKKKDKTKNKRQYQTEGMELEKSKKKKASSGVSEEKVDDRIKETTISEGHIEYQECNQSSELTVTGSNSKEAKNKTGKLAINNNATLFCKNIKQGGKVPNFGLSPIYRLLAAESEFSNARHACQTCCKCKPHRDVARVESEDFRNIVIKTEPGVTIKQEKEDVDNNDPRVMDTNILAVKEGLQNEVSTNTVVRTDDGLKNIESLDKSIENFTAKKEPACTQSDTGPNEYSEDMQADRIDDNEFDAGEYVESFSNEYIVNGNEERDIDIPHYNIYDDKITLKEEVLDFTNTHDYQNDDRQRMENTPGVNIKSVERQNTACVNSANNLTSVSVFDSANSVKTADVQMTTCVREVNGLNEPVSLNELENRYSLEVVPKSVFVQNNTWNEEQAENLYWSSLNTHEQQTSHTCDIGAFTTGQVNFPHVPRW